MPALAYEPSADDPQSLRAIASAKVSQNLDEALDWYKRAADKGSQEYGANSPYVADIYFEMGSLALDAKKFRLAENCLQTAVERNPNSVMARVKLAELLEIKDQSDAALKEILTALGKDGKSPEARNALVLWLIRNKKPAEAVHESYIMNQALAEQRKPESANKLASLLSAPIKSPPSAPVQAQTPKVEKSEPAPAAVPNVPKPIDLSNMVMQMFKPKVEKPAPKPIEKPKHETKKHEKEKPRKERKPPAPKPAPVKVAPVKPATKPSAKQPKQEIELKEEKATPAALQTTAKQVDKKSETKKQEAEPATPTENEVKASKPVKQEQPPAQAVPAQPAVTFQAPPPSKASKKRGLVPPPPPTVPMPMWAPPPQMMVPPPVNMPPPKARPKREAPKEPAKEPAKEPEEKHTSNSSQDDSEFILDWAGTNKNKKKPVNHSSE